LCRGTFSASYAYLKQLVKLFYDAVNLQHVVRNPFQAPRGKPFVTQIVFVDPKQIEGDMRGGTVLPIGEF